MLSLRSHPELHPIFETLGYVLGLLAYRRQRAGSGDFLANPQRLGIIAAAIVGALIGSRLLGLLEQVPRVGFHLSQLLSPGGGKTIVGGLLGGWLGVELLKIIQQIDSRTGDLFAIPLCVGIAIGRIGCLLAGLADDTYGTPAHLPWAVDFGDGIPRHPIQAYEIIFLVILIGALRWMQHRRAVRQGSLFRIFLATYLGWRFLIDFLKPQPVYVAGLNAIQLACVGGILLLLFTWPRDLETNPTLSGESAHV